VQGAKFRALWQNRQPLFARITNFSFSFFEFVVNPPNQSPYVEAPQDLLPTIKRQEICYVFRSVALFIGLLPAILLGIAADLQPNPQGLGTHQQLGLPPCSLRVLAGIRCPGCGMTTSWSHFMQGRWWASMQANVAGFLFAWAALAVIFFGLRAAIQGRLPSRQTQRIGTYWLVGCMAVALVDWIFRLSL
jgi:Protein of unknown function (DUF2752)